MLVLYFPTQRLIHHKNILIVCLGVCGFSVISLNWRGLFCVEVACLFHLQKIFLLLPPQHLSFIIYFF